MGKEYEVGDSVELVTSYRGYRYATIVGIEYPKFSNGARECFYSDEFKGVK